MSVIAVTGATGNLGGLVVNHLLDQGVSASNIVPFVRSEEKGEHFRVRGISPRVASYDDPAGFEKALGGIDKLVLISPPVLDNAKRLHMLHGTVMAAYAAQLQQLAYVSLADPEERPFQLEDVDLAIEHSILATGMPFTFLRNSVYLDELGPELAVAAESGELVSATGNHTLNWAPRADMAASIASSVATEGHLGKTYNLVSPHSFTYADIAALLSQATSRTITHRQVNPEEAIQALIKGGMDPDSAKSMVEYFHRAIESGKCRTTGNDIEQLSGRSGKPTAEYLAALVARASL